MGAKIVSLAARPAALKKRLRKHLATCGFSRNGDGSLHLEEISKDMVRSLHRVQRSDRLSSNASFIKENRSQLGSHFAAGTDIQPEKIRPVLQRISAGTWESDLFRFASLTWSIPVSNGFGRRMRYLVWDQANGKLIGLIAIGDPVFNLTVRDRTIGWNSADRAARLVNVMDAYVLGAVPPYNILLGGKLVSSLVRTRDIYDDFTRTYGGATGIISREEKKPRLLAITTSSSLGKSSIYNRLKLKGLPYFQPIGFTRGWGHFHIPDALFRDLRNYLRDIGHDYADLNRFGQGPNWRLRTTRVALEELGLNTQILRHGIEREVYLCLLARNAIKILKSGKGRPDLSSLLSAEDVASHALERWVIPRAGRMPEFRNWTLESLYETLGQPKGGAERKVKSGPTRHGAK